MTQQEPAIGIRRARSGPHHHDGLAVCLVGILVAAGIIKNERAVHQPQPIDAALRGERIERVDCAVEIMRTGKRPGLDDAICQGCEQTRRRRADIFDDRRVVFLHQRADLQHKVCRTIA